MKRVLPIDLVRHDATLRRLQAAGIVADFRLDRSGHASIRWSQPYLCLLLAGRRPMAEPGMRAAWATGDPARVKEWVEGEARAVDR